MVRVGHQMVQYCARNGWTVHEYDWPVCRRYSGDRRNLGELCPISDLGQIYVGYRILSFAVDLGYLWSHVQAALWLELDGASLADSLSLHVLLKGDSQLLTCRNYWKYVRVILALECIVHFLLICTDSDDRMVDICNDRACWVLSDAGTTFFLHRQFQTAWSTLCVSRRSRRALDGCRCCRFPCSKDQSPLQPQNRPLQMIIWFLFRFATFKTLGWYRYCYLGPVLPIQYLMNACVCLDVWLQTVRWMLTIRWSPLQERARVLWREAGRIGRLLMLVTSPLHDAKYRYESSILYLVSFIAASVLFKMQQTALWPRSDDKSPLEVGLSI